MTGRIRLEVEPPLATLVIDNPTRRNAMNMDMYRAMADQVAAARAHDDVRVVVVRGEGEEAFGAGSDISEFASARTGDDASGYDQVEHRAQTALRTVDLPVVASIRGACMGGGAAIALCADIRYASETAVFSVPPARLGIGYPIDAVESLVATVGATRAKELLFTARRVGADEALAIGLVHRVVPEADLDGEVAELVAQLAANAPLTIRAAKLAIDQVTRPFDDRDPAAVRAAVAACYASDDYREGIAAFGERRPPRFEGR